MSYTIKKHKKTYAVNPEDWQLMQNYVKYYWDSIELAKLDYEQGNIPRFEQVKNIRMRFVWDLCANLR